MQSAFNSEKDLDRNRMSIVQIARRAGVSTATVSRVLNDIPGVRQETQRQVRLGVEELKYVTPLIKRGPKPGKNRRERSGRRTNTIAVLAIGDSMEWLQLPVMAAAVGGITQAARHLALKVQLEEMVDHAKPTQSLLNREVDGAVVFLSSNIKPTDFQAALIAVQKNVPVVWAMGGDAGVTEVDHIIPDDRAISRLAFNTLVQQGCKNLAFLTLAPKWAMMRNRGQFFASIAHDAGVNWSTYIRSDDPRDAELFGPRTVVEPRLASLIDRLLAASPKLDGIFIGNDATTCYAHPMLLERGVIPGKDIILVSCDNERPSLAGLTPRPISIDINAAEVGAVAVRRLAFRIDHPNDPPVMIKVAPFIPESSPAISHS
jgi:LacI family transcriptional regulator